MIDSLFDKDFIHIRFKRTDTILFSSSMQSTFSSFANSNNKTYLHENNQFVANLDPTQKLIKMQQKSKITRPSQLLLAKRSSKMGISQSFSSIQQLSDKSTADSKNSKGTIWASSIRDIMKDEPIKIKLVQTVQPKPKPQNLHPEKIKKPVFNLQPTPEISIKNGPTKQTIKEKPKFTLLEATPRKDLNLIQSQKISPQQKVSISTSPFIPNNKMAMATNTAVVEQSPIFITKRQHKSASHLSLNSTTENHLTIQNHKDKRSFGFVVTISLISLLFIMLSLTSLL
ncbi:hypothetical protein TRFO_24697 [Tritrichomonas foetus]|uniref:Uncharacterized protein n=1 Tax=Tritrichomonas foetus TaxID=1144522 RepID=A0A1J4KBI6_9EUKA|nr:hypothetical protein TRFO_24697 [Tritrichomonas foetus]|eukprot:OHT07052.1 hypothetical protein TRFO_24697 [Tritrichomonas foetus]